MSLVEETICSDTQWALSEGGLIIRKIFILILVVNLKIQIVGFVIENTYEEKQEGSWTQ